MMRFNLDVEKELEIGPVEYTTGVCYKVYEITDGGTLREPERVPGYKDFRRYATFDEAVGAIAWKHKNGISLGELTILPIVERVTK